MNQRRTQDIPRTGLPWSWNLGSRNSFHSQRLPRVRNLITKIFAVMILVAPLLPPEDAFARAGRGRSSGKSFNRSAPPAPVHRQPAPPPASHSTTPQSGAGTATTPPTGPSTVQGQGPTAGPAATPFAREVASPRPSGGLMRNMATAVAGGFLGSMLFSGLSHGFGGNSASSDGLATPEGASVPRSTGIGLLEILFLGMLGYLGYRVWKSRQEKLAIQTQMGRFSYPSSPLSDSPLAVGQVGGADGSKGFGSHQRTGHAAESWQEQKYQDTANRRSFLSDPEIGLSTPPASLGSSTGLIGAPVTPLQSGTSSSHTSFDEGASLDQNQVKDVVRDIFYRVQTAWSRRDLSGVKKLLTAEMYQSLSGDMAELIAAREINRLENISITDLEVIKTWNEASELMMAVRLSAYMLDYTVRETTQELVRGSQMEPTRFEEIWVFKKDPFQDNWLLAGIEIEA